MKRLHSAVRRTVHAVRHHLIISSIVTVGILGCVGGSIVLAAHKPTANPTLHTPAIHTQSSVKAAETVSGGATQDNTTAAGNAAASTANKPKATSPQAPTPSSQKRLVISPDSFTVKAGTAYSSVTMKSDDGKGVNMPMVGSDPQGIFTNFPAGPAKASWSGSIMVMHTVQPGTYTVTFKAQADRTTWYTGTVSITVLPTGTGTVSVQQTGYDAALDAMIFSVKLNRQSGYTLAVSRWFAIDTGNTLECPFDEVAPDTYEVYCSHTQGTRPTAGRLDVNIFMADGATVLQGSSPFSLPVKP